MRILLIIPLLLLFSCNDCAQEKFTEADKQQVKTEVIAMFDAYNQAVSRQGIIGERSYLDSSDEFFWVPPGYGGPIDYDSVIRYAEQITPKYKWVKPEWKKLEIQPRTKELAVYTGTLEFNAEDTAGNPISILLLETGVLVKRPDGWKLLNGQSAVKQ